LKIGQVNLVHLLFLLCASGFRARLASHFAWSLTRPPFVLQRRRIGTALSFSTVALVCRIISLGPFTALIAFHPGAELVQRHGAEHRDPLAEHLERHPHGVLAALAADLGITFGLKLGDGAVVCHPRIKARSKRERTGFRPRSIPGVPPKKGVLAELGHSQIQIEPLCNEVAPRPLTICRGETCPQPTRRPATSPLHRSARRGRLARE
jgi:hypothetical protein